MKTITAALIVKNEGSYLVRALRSLLWCDEIIVVEYGSTDDTKAICINPDAPWAKKIKFIEKEWMGFSVQRNFLIEQVSSDWIFFLDGDEACSPELAYRIQGMLKTPKDPTPAIYWIRRQEYFLKQPIHYSIWNPSYHPRLFPKGTVQFTKTVHEGITTDLPRIKIIEPIHHVEDLKIERFLDKLNRYTTLQAQDDFDRGFRSNIIKILLAFPAMWFKNYFYYRGYRDGVAGFVISCLEGISRTVRHLKIWQLSR